MADRDTLHLTRERILEIVAEHWGKDMADAAFGPVPLPPSLYEAAERAGHDMTGYRKNELIPFAPSDRPCRGEDR